MRKKIIYLVIVLCSTLNYAEDYEKKVYKNINETPSSFGIHSDLAYSSYMIEIHSSEIDSAIDYNILEFTLGGSYSFKRWMWGIYSKFVIDELNSNLYINKTDQKLKDRANIDKNEFAIYSNYTLREDSDNIYRVNLIYRESSLNAQKSYLSYHQYNSIFKYKTQDLAISLLYHKKLFNNNSYFINIGTLYSRAKVEISESVNSQQQDTFIDDNSHTIGIKLGMGYNIKLSNSLFFNTRVDGWRSNFKRLKVQSRVGDRLPDAKLKECSYSIYGGITLILPTNSHQ